MAKFYNTNKKEYHMYNIKGIDYNFKTIEELKKYIEFYCTNRNSVFSVDKMMSFIGNRIEIYQDNDLISCIQSRKDFESFVYG